MKKSAIFITVALFLVVGCTATKSASEVAEPVEPAPAPQQVEALVVEPEPVPEQEPVPELEPEPVPPPKELTPEEEEFLRSTVALNGSGTVSMDTFTKDKKDILDIIDDLAVIMKNGNYNSWLSYVSSESKTYWMNPSHLKEIEARLPVKGLRISGLRDYFKYIFIPARSGHHVDEIRYVSDTVVKAVQAKENRDIVYYTFEKIDGKWLLKLDTL